MKPHPYLFQINVGDRLTSRSSPSRMQVTEHVAQRKYISLVRRLVWKTITWHVQQDLQPIVPISIKTNEYL